MSPYFIYPTFNFTDSVYKDGFRILVYKVVKKVPSNFVHNLFPYEAIFEENSYVKIRTMQNPSNYVLYYDTKFLNDPSYVLRRNGTFTNNNSLVKCKVHEFNVNRIKLALLKENNFDIKQINGTMDDLIVSLEYYNTTKEYIEYRLCKIAPNGKLVQAKKEIVTEHDDERFTDSIIMYKFAVELDYLDAYECYKYKTNNLKYMELKKGINKLPINKDSDWICDDKQAFASLIKYGVPTEFIYKNILVDNMVFTVEDIYRSYRNNVVYGPIYKSYMD